MDHIKDVLAGVQQRPANSTVQEQPNSDAEYECSTCEGRRLVRVERPLDHPEFGKAQPCPACVTREREAKDWFAWLDVAPENREAIELAKRMAHTPSGWLVIQGPVGSGKTALAAAILSTLRGKETVPMSVPWLLDYWRSKIKDNEFEAVFFELASAPMAILDDLGVERATDWAAEKIPEYLDHRYVHRLATVITTNCDEDMLAHQLGERVADRVFDQRSGLVRVVSIDLPSYRTGKRW